MAKNADNKTTTPIEILKYGDYRILSTKDFEGKKFIVEKNKRDSLGADAWHIVETLDYKSAEWIFVMLDYAANKGILHHINSIG